MLIVTSPALVTVYAFDSVNQQTLCISKQRWHFILLVFQHNLISPKLVTDLKRNMSFWALLSKSESWCFSLSADVESVMNSIVSLLLILETEKQEALIESLCEKLVKFREGERPSLRMQL